jgi:dihydroxyacetone kinase phosphoprotein-dependent L subunit
MKTIALEQWKLMFIAASDAIAENEKYLNELDSLIGDGDHGSSIRRGFEAVRSVITTSDFRSIGDLFSKVGMEMLQEIGGAIGPLLGSFFTSAGKNARDLTEVDLQIWSGMFSTGVAKVRNFGKASPGDKTMVDALQPASEAFENAAQINLSILIAFQNAVTSARQGADKTSDMVAKFGRAKFLGERALGHQDPGANSIFFILNAMNNVLTDFDKRNSQ